MDVLILAKYDWANTGYRFYKCLRHLGVDVLMLKGEFHPFYYPDQAPIHPVLTKLSDGHFHQAPQLKFLTDQAKVVHYIASAFIDTGTDFFNKTVVMQHGGKSYRQYPENLNKIHNQFVNTTIIQCPDLLGYGANNEQWIYYPVDTDFIQPKFRRRRKKIIIGHFPSRFLGKGSDKIAEIITKLENDSKFSSLFEFVGPKSAKEHEQIGRRLWTDNLNCIALCDVIIETLLPEVQEHKFGEWGNTALEAAAMGKIVVTNSLAKDLYAKEFGSCALQIANDPKALEQTLKMILSLSDKEIQDKKQESRDWVEQKHSIPATANRLWDKVYRELL